MNLEDWKTTEDPQYLHVRVLSMLTIFLVLAPKPSTSFLVSQTVNSHNCD